MRYLITGATGFIGAEVASWRAELLAVPHAA
jgi:uncharacterized protein YbjT (DUF2867 family)